MDFSSGQNICYWRKSLGHPSAVDILTIDGSSNDDSERCPKSCKETMQGCRIHDNVLRGAISYSIGE